MPQTMKTPSILSIKKVMTGSGYSIWARIGDMAVKIRVMKLQRPRAVAAKSTGNTDAWLTYRMLNADEMPNLAIRMKNGNQIES